MLASLSELMAAIQMYPQPRRTCLKTALVLFVAGLNYNGVGMGVGGGVELGGGAREAITPSQCSTLFMPL